MLKKNYFLRIVVLASCFSSFVASAAGRAGSTTNDPEKGRVYQKTVFIEGPFVSTSELSEAKRALAIIGYLEKCKTRRDSLLSKTKTHLKFISTCDQYTVELRYLANYSFYTPGPLAPGEHRYITELDALENSPLQPHVPRGWSSSKIHSATLLGYVVTGSLDVNFAVPRTDFSQEFETHQELLLATSTYNVAGELNQSQIECETFLNTVCEETSESLATQWKSDLVYFGCEVEWSAPYLSSLHNFQVSDEPLIRNLRACGIKLRYRVLAH